MASDGKEPWMPPLMAYALLAAHGFWPRYRAAFLHVHYVSATTYTVSQLAMIRSECFWEIFKNKNKNENLVIMIIGTIFSSSKSSWVCL